jgi:DNA polymerase-3 subunit gamma/tau
MTEQNQSEQNQSEQNQPDQNQSEQSGQPAQNQPVPGPRPAPPGAPTSDGPTGDPQIDAALAELEGAAPDDLDAQVEAGGRVHRTLQSRLSDLGGQ